MTQGKLFEPILDLVIETMPRDNLLNSACLEFFDFIKRENIKNIISHLVENYRDKLKAITYVDIFSNFIMRYDQTSGFAPSLETSFLDTEDEGPKRPETGRGNRWESGIKDLDAAEEEYFNTSDDEDEAAGKASSSRRSAVNGASPLKPLVDYNSDEENENMETDLSAGIRGADENTPLSSKNSDNGIVLTLTSSTGPSPPEKLAEKRRREDEDEDEITKLSSNKRRSSSSAGSNTSSVLRRKKSFTNSSQGGGGNGGKPQKIAISFSPAIKTGGESPGGGGNGS